MHAWRNGFLILSVAIVATKAAQEVMDFFTIDAGSIEARKVRKYSGQMLRLKEKLDKTGNEDLFYLVVQPTPPSWVDGSNAADMQPGTYMS